MTRKYKTSYKGSRGLKRFHVTFDAPVIASQVEERCTVCGGEIEKAPILRGTCYDCYCAMIAAKNAGTDSAHVKTAGHTYVNWHNRIFFDVTAMGEETAKRMQPLKERIDARMSEAAKHARRQFHHE